MFLLPTFLGQLVVTWASKLDGISFQMVENVPFYHALAAVVIAEQGYGMDSLATLFFLFGLASVFVGAIFYALGALKMGRVVYFIPSHILLGCIGGIGESPTKKQTTATSKRRSKRRQCSHLFAFSCSRNICCRDWSVDVSLCSQSINSAPSSHRFFRNPSHHQRNVLSV